MRRRRNIFVNSRTVELELWDSGLIFIQVYAIQKGKRNAYIFHTGLLLYLLKICIKAD